MESNVELLPTNHPQFNSCSSLVSLSCGLSQDGYRIVNLCEPLLFVCSVDDEYAIRQYSMWSYAIWIFVQFGQLRGIVEVKQQFTLSTMSSIQKGKLKSKKAEDGSKNTQKSEQLDTITAQNETQAKPDKKKKKRKKDDNEREIDDAAPKLESTPAAHPVDQEGKKKKRKKHTDGLNQEKNSLASNEHVGEATVPETTTTADVDMVDIDDLKDDDETTNDIKKDKKKKKKKKKSHDSSTEATLTTPGNIPVSLSTDPHVDSSKSQDLTSEPTGSVSEKKNVDLSVSTSAENVENSKKSKKNKKEKKGEASIQDIQSLCYFSCVFLDQASQFKDIKRLN
jgi:hypothetical protein